jgi:hypothetical protein
MTGAHPAEDEVSDTMRWFRRAVGCSALAGLLAWIPAGVPAATSRTSGAAAGRRDAVPGRVRATVLSGPVSVIAELDSTWGAYVESGPWEVRLRIVHRSGCFEAMTYLVQPETWTEAVDMLRQTTGWKGGYLFVETTCGAGNAWKCRVENVFALRRGQLVPLGALMNDDDEVGASFRHGMFYDLDVDWEGNYITSHAGMPVILLALRDADGHLEVDLDSTWQRSLTRYRDSAASSYVDMIRTSALLGNAVIATYCRRPSEADTVMAEVLRTLDPETVRRMQSIIERIEPGRLPRTSRTGFRQCGSATR